MLLAGRSIGLCVGIFSLIATFLGGAFINEITNTIFHDGLVWCQAIPGYVLSFLFGNSIKLTLKSIDLTFSKLI